MYNSKDHFSKDDRFLTLVDFYCLALSTFSDIPFERPKVTPFDITRAPPGPGLREMGTSGFSSGMWATRNGGRSKSDGTPGRPSRNVT